MKHHVIDDSTRPEELRIDDPDKGRGLELPPPEFRSYAGIARPFPRELLIPRGEWQARIKEREERKAKIRTRVQAAGVKVKNQGRTPYCWINSPTWILQALRVLSGLPHVELSPASAGSLITGFRARGGWGRDGVQHLVDLGVTPSALWPDNAIERRYATEEAKAEALKYKFDEWWVLDSRDHDQVVSCLLRGTPVSAGLNWWGHQVSYTDPVWLDGTACIEFANSWGVGYGDEGYGILQGNRMLADDAVAPATAIAA